MGMKGAGAGPWEYTSKPPGLTILSAPQFIFQWIKTYGEGKLWRECCKFVLHRHRGPLGGSVRTAARIAAAVAVAEDSTAAILVRRPLLR